jgi:uncharacterized protein (DUF2062 family)
LTLSKQPSFFHKRVIHPLKNLLTMGITPQKLAVTVALGMVIGIMPLFGPITLLCTVVSMRFKLNLPALLLICYLMGPLHIVLYIPFIQLGLAIFELTTFQLTMEEVMKLFAEDWLQALKTVWLANLAGVLVWLVLAAPLTFFIYLIALPILKKLMKRAQMRQMQS